MIYQRAPWFIQKYTFFIRRIQWNVKNCFLLCEFNWGLFWITTFFFFFLQIIRHFQSLLIISFLHKKSSLAWVLFENFSDEMACIDLKMIKNTKFLDVNLTIEMCSF